MTIKSKEFTSRSEIDDVYESAIEWQKRARQNHGITLDIRDCIGMVLKFSYSSAMCGVENNLGEIIRLATSDENANQ